MRTSILISALAALSAAHPQALTARHACAAQPTSANTYHVDLSCAQEFRRDSNIAKVAKGAATPSGYDETFVNLGGASNAYGYMGITTLSNYDPSACATLCNKAAGCLGFNIYFERDPVVEPGTGCTNPKATANIKCSLWAGPVFSGTAANTGKIQFLFEGAIAGSNGYTSSAHKSISGFTGPTPIGTSAIKAPLDRNGKDTYIGYKLFTTGRFDPRLCSTACIATSASKPCRFFNTYMLYKNHVAQGQYCSLYTESWDASYATDKGQTHGPGYTIEYSFTFADAKNPSPGICSADIAYLKSAGSKFCSSYISYVAPVTTTTVTLRPSTSTIHSTTLVPVTTVDVITHVITSVSIETVTAAQLVPLKRGREARNAAIATPASIASWPRSKISAACSLIATGCSTITVTKPASRPLATIIETDFTTVIETSFVTSTLLETSTTAVTPSVQSSSVGTGSTSSSAVSSSPSSSAAASSSSNSAVSISSSSSVTASYSSSSAAASSPSSSAAASSSSSSAAASSSSSSAAAGSSSSSAAASSPSSSAAASSPSSSAAAGSSSSSAAASSPSSSAAASSSSSSAAASSSSSSAAASSSSSSAAASSSSSSAAASSSSSSAAASSTSSSAAASSTSSSAAASSSSTSDAPSSSSSSAAASSTSSSAAASSSSTSDAPSSSSSSAAASSTSSSNAPSSTPSAAASTSSSDLPSSTLSAAASSTSSSDAPSSTPSAAASTSSSDLPSSTPSAAASTFSSDAPSSTSSAAASSSQPSAAASSTTSTTSATPTATNLLVNGDFNSGTLAGWTVSVMQNTGTSDAPVVGTSDSPTNSPHLIYAMNTPSNSDSSILTMSQSITMAQANTWYKVTWSYMFESVGPFASGSDCYIFGSSSAGQFFRQYAPSQSGYSNEDSVNACSSTLVEQPVPNAGEWVTVSAYMQFKDSQKYAYNPTTHRYGFVDSGVLNTMFYIYAACGEGISNTIHVDDVFLEVATCS